MAIMNNQLEKDLWKFADTLRGNLSAEEYMYVIIGLMFLKHMSDKYKFALEKMKKHDPSRFEKNKNDKDYLSEYGCPFIIPQKANWDYVSKDATSPKIGETIDNAFLEIENKNPELKSLFDKNFNRESLDQSKLGKLVSEFSNLNLEKFDEDLIGRVYEYFLGEFFKKQGQKGGEFYTPMSIVELMVKIVNPVKGKLYDPASGTGGMFVQAKKNIQNIGQDPINLVVYGQEYQNKTWKLSRINLLLHEFQPGNIKLGNKSADTFTDDQHKNEKFDYILANPPFNIKDWGYEQLKEDSRWEFGLPPKGNANYAWISLMVHKLKPTGKGATVLANGSLTGSSKEEKQIRMNLINRNYIDAIIAVPDKLFYTTGIPACIWVFNKNKQSKDILMIDASNFSGNMLSKTLREITKDEIKKIVDLYKKHEKNEKIEVTGFAKSVSKKEIEENDYSFSPGRYVGIVKEEIDVEKTKEEISQLANQIKNLFKEFNEISKEVEKSIEKVLK